MLQLVIRDYRALFRNSLREVDMSAFVVYWWLLVYPPIFLHMSYAGYWCHYVYFIMLQLGLLLSRLYPNRMSKTLLLCPLSQEQKEKYIKTGYLLRVLASVCLFLFLMLCAVMAIWFHDGTLPKEGWLWFGLIWQYVLAMAGYHIYSAPVANSAYPTQREYKLPGNYEVWNILQQLSAVFGGMLLVSALTDQKPESTPELVIESLVLMVQTAVCIKVVITYGRPVIEQAVHYEYRQVVRAGGK